MDYSLCYNADSSFVISTLEDNSQMISEPVSFLVINLKDREKVMVSIKEYHKVTWIDKDNILLVKYLGVPDNNQNLTRKPVSNRIEYILNVPTKELRIKPRSEQETL
jgi:hypothetical protein